MRGGHRAPADIRADGVAPASRRVICRSVLRRGQDHRRVGQAHEDVVAIDYRPRVRHGSRSRRPGDRSSAFEWAVERSIATGGIVPDADARPTRRPSRPRWRAHAGVVSARSRGAVGRPRSRSPCATWPPRDPGEAQVLSPHETWSSITPWTRASRSERAPGDDHVRCRPPRDVVTGTYWALVKSCTSGDLYSSPCPSGSSPKAILARPTILRPCAPGRPLRGVPQPNGSRMAELERRIRRHTWTARSRDRGDERPRLTKGEIEGSSAV